MSNQDTETVAEPKGLDAILGAALDEHYVEPGAPAPEVAPKDPAAATEAAPTDSRPRDDRGRFLSGDTEPSKGTAQPSVAAPDKAATAPDPAIKPIVEAPRNYTAEQKAQFATLPREAQEALSRTEQAREAEYTRRSQEIAEYRRTADPLVQAVSPYREYLGKIAPSIGQTPEGMINAILATEWQLRNGEPAQKYQAFAQLAQQYGVDLRAFASGQMPAQTQPYQPSINPEVQRELSELKQWRSQVQEQQELHASHQQISDFAAQKDDAGQAKYPHFDRVRPAMASFLQAGHAESLEDAYKLAVEPFQQLIDQGLKAAEDERKAALEKAKKAAPVKTSTGNVPQGKNELKGLDAHLSAAMDKYLT